jgi:ribosome-binding protein aMBF1 (putative translation factor)
VVICQKLLNFIKPIGKGEMICEMCGTYKMKSQLYMWTGMLTKDKMKICHPCAMREEFGNKYKQNKRYQRWIEDGEQKQS